MKKLETIPIGTESLFTLIKTYTCTFYLIGCASSSELSSRMSSWLIHCEL